MEMTQRIDLLDRVRQLSPAEFDDFIERAFSVRPQAANAKLSAEETKLVQRINRGLPDEVSRRLNQLIRRRDRDSLTAVEQQELNRLTELAERYDVERVEALAELARVRRVPVRTLMARMGIKAAPAHG